ncbi:MAG: nucleotidyltransferase [Candidatus Rokuibacteriota bacterium]
MAVAEARPEAARFYVAALRALTDAGVPFLVGGAYSFERYTGIARDTKDLDVFVRRQGFDRALGVLAAAGYRTETTFPHWLGKAHDGEDVLDVIFSSGNGCAVVDDEWFAHAVDDSVLGVTVRLCPPEETIWSKAFIMERERYDGADVAHLLRACADRLDWRRLLRRFGPHWRVLLAHLVLFGFVYPSENGRIPREVMTELTRRLSRDAGRTSAAPVCFGTLLSRAQYLVDVETWGYRDGRLEHGTMTEGDVAVWTSAIEVGQPKPGGGPEDDAAGGDR